MTVKFLLGAYCALVTAAFCTAQDEALQRDTLKYGTDNEISALINTLKKDNADYLDNDLTQIVQNTKNSKIKSQIIGFFAEREKKGLENDAIYIIENRDEIESSNVLSAIDYLRAIKYTKAQDVLRALLEVDEEVYTNAVIKAIGTATDATNADSTADYLISYYQEKNPADDFQRSVILALGETRSKRATAFLNGIISENERAGLTIAALSSVANIADDNSLNVVIHAASSKDPVIRAASVEALGSFNGDATVKALLDAFRDSFYKTRLAAVKSAGKRRIKEAVPYLKFRIEKDDVPAVQDEAVRSLGLIGDNESNNILESFFDDKKTADRLKIIIAEMLIKTNADEFTDKIIAKLDESKRLNQKQLYKGLINALSKAETPRIQPLVARLFASKDATDKAYALELTAINKFGNFAPEVGHLASESNSGLARKAKEVLEKLQ